MKLKKQYEFVRQADKRVHSPAKSVDDRIINSAVHTNQTILVYREETQPVLPSSVTLYHSTPRLS